MQTVDELIRRRVGDHRIGLRFEDRSWTHDEVVHRAADRAAVLERLRRPGPFHVALLLENVPEYVFWMSAAALVGAVVVGGNPTHRGDELARDLSHTECQLLVTDATHFELVRGRDLGLARSWQPEVGLDPYRTPASGPLCSYRHGSTGEG